MNAQDVVGNLKRCVDRYSQLFPISELSGSSTVRVSLPGRLSYGKRPVRKADFRGDREEASATAGKGAGCLL